MFLYVAIAVVIYASIVLFVDHQFRTHQPTDLPLKWLGFAAMTALVFGDTIRINRRWWGQPRFWLLLGAFFGAQCALGIAILSTVTKMSTMVWAFLIPLDYVALSAYLGYFLELRPEARSPRKEH